MFQKSSTFVQILYRMEHLPTNPDILVSSINMLLRDGEYESLEDLCSSFDRDMQQLLAELQQAGYYYNQEQRQFRYL